VFKKRIGRDRLLAGEGDAFRWALLLYLGEQYARRGWVMEIHFGAVRNCNTRMYGKLGPDHRLTTASAALDCMPGLAPLLDELDRKIALPKTLVFSLNPNDNAAIVSVPRLFFAARRQGQASAGLGLWFNDNKTGMQEQMTSFANLSALGNFHRHAYRFAQLFKLRPP
jgi:glucuronate isomerase